MAVQKAKHIYRDFQTDGVPSSGANRPKKRELREWGTNVEQMMLGASAGATIYDSKVDLDADTSQAANAMAWVLGDPVVANNGIYQFDGTSTWTRLGDLPYSYIKATNAGAGTANAIVATTDVPVPAADGGALIALPIVADNTGAATVVFNGGSALNIKRRDRENVVSGDLMPGIYAGYKTGSDFQLVSDVSSLRNYLAARDEADRATTQANRAASESDAAQASASQAQDLIEAATAGFTGFADNQSYDFGYVADATTYFDQDWGSISA